VADEQEGQVKRPLKTDEQLQYLRLDAHIERRGRFVQHHEPRLAGERAGDADPLPLPSREFVREAAKVTPLHPDKLEEFGGAVRHLPRREAQRRAVDLHRLADDVAHRHARVERGHRVLEDDLDARAHSLQRPGRERMDVLALEQDAPCRRPLQREDKPRQRRLARARLAHDAEAFAPLHREAHPVERADRRAARAEPCARRGVVLDDVLDRQDRHAPLSDVA
jgi:hypothetical protein